MKHYLIPLLFLAALTARGQGQAPPINPTQRVQNVFWAVPGGTHILYPKADSIKLAAAVAKLATIPTGGGSGTGVSGVSSYTALTDRPSVFPPAVHVHAVGDITGLTSALAAKLDVLTGDGRYMLLGYVPTWTSITGKPSFFSGSYTDLTNKPVLFSGSYLDLTNKPTIPAAFSGSYLDLTNRPTLFTGVYADLSGKPTLFSGAYSALTGIPSTFAPSAHTHAATDVTTDATHRFVTDTQIAGWNASTGSGFSGNYNDLINKPTIPTVPSVISAFTNDAAYITRAGLSATGPVAYNLATGAFSMAPATTSVSGYLSSTDWNTFNGKQAALGFTPYNATNPSGFQTSTQVSDAITTALTGRLLITTYNSYTAAQSTVDTDQNTAIAARVTTSTYNTDRTTDVAATTAAANAASAAQTTANTANTTANAALPTATYNTNRTADQTTAANASNLTSGTIPAARLPTTAVTPGTYTNANLTIGADGRVTAAANGSAGGTATTSASDLTSGTLPDARLSANVNTTNTAQTISAAKTFTVAPTVPTASTTATGQGVANYDWIRAYLAALPGGVMIDNVTLKGNGRDTSVYIDRNLMATRTYADSLGSTRMSATYTISRIGTTTYAIPAVTGLPYLTNTDSYTVIQGAINALTPTGGGVGSAGGKIRIKGAVYTLSNELTITGWEGAGINPFSQIIIEGDGFSTFITQSTTGKNAFVVRNGASFVLRNLRVFAAPAARSALLLDNNGASTEMSANRSILDNVRFYSNSATYPTVYLKNFFDLSVPAANFENNNAAGDALLLENNSATTNYGNSNFGFLRTYAGETSGAGLRVRNVGNTNFMNLLTFDNYECAHGYYGIYSEGLKFSTFKLVDCEYLPFPIYFTGTAASYTHETEGVHVLSGYLLAQGTGATGITTSLYTTGNTFSKLTIPAGIPIVDGSNYRLPNSYDDIHIGDVARASLISISNPDKTYLKYKTYDGDNVYTRLTSNTTGATVAAGDISTKLATTAFVAAKSIRTVTASGAALVSDYTLLVNATSGSVTLTLPAASTYPPGAILNIKKIDSSVNTVTIDPSGSETIDGALTYILDTQYESINLQTNGTAWFLL